MTFQGRRDLGRSWKANLQEPMPCGTWGYFDSGKSVTTAESQKPLGPGGVDDLAAALAVDQEGQEAKQSLFINWTEPNAARP